MQRPSPSLFPRLKPIPIPIPNHRSFTHSTATLLLPSHKPQSVWCVAGGAPDYTVVVERTIGCALAGRDLGPGSVKIDLLFHGGRHFARGMIPCDLYFERLVAER